MVSAYKNLEYEVRQRLYAAQNLIEHSYWGGIKRSKIKLKSK